MNFLQLCQRLSQEVRLSNSALSTTVSQTGMNGKLVDWINAAWVDLQEWRNEWRWMVGSFTVNTISGTRAYSTTDCSITSFRYWRPDTFKIYLNSGGVAGERKLDYLDYQDWYELYNTGTINSGYPIHFTVDHDNDILLGPKPDAVYVVSGEYQKAASELSGNTDSPGLPSEFHMAIVYRAMMKYGRSTAASEIYEDGKTEFRRMVAAMERTQLPQMIKAGPLC